MKDGYYLAENAYNSAKKCDLYGDMKREMEREIRERLEKEIRLKMMELLTEDAKRAMEKASKQHDHLIAKGAPHQAIYYALGEAHTYERMYNDFKTTLNDMKAKWGDPSKEGLGKYVRSEE